ncbi:MAG: bifunctional phosphoribosylaminoimidazolecarboxamide formyltransferase/IMP cyclohydrolase, partial [Acidimicrobiales bacterium]
MMRALLSVSDKNGIEAFAEGLLGLGWELLASGGTAAVLQAAGMAHRSVESVTGYPELLGGRVKTLHPAVHAAILAERDLPEHLDELAGWGIEPIDLVVCNLYPFSASPEVEMIDIGGPAMVRAAAKSFAHVGVVTDPSGYAAILQELSERGELSLDTRARLAAEAFSLTSAYDDRVAAWLLAAPEARPGATTPGPLPPRLPAHPEAAHPGGLLPASLVLRLERAEQLRYGENPHQSGARYRLEGGGWWDGAVSHGGTALSYLNVFDAEAAWQLAWELLGAPEVGDRCAAVVVKHANPCGAALDADPVTAVAEAVACDPQSAFGGIVAVTARLGAEVAEVLVAGPQLDVVVAPCYEQAALDALRARRRSTRILSAPRPKRPRFELRALDGGFLYQESDGLDLGRDGWEVVAGAEPGAALWQDLELAWRVCARTCSNAVVVATAGRVPGIGAGQPSRVGAAR